MSSAVKRLMLIGPVAMCVTALLGRPAEAGCIYLSGGGRYCASWITGSEICDTATSGLGSIKGCVPGSNCPVVTCSVYGTVDTGKGCDPDVLDPNCGIAGVGFCANPKGMSNPQGQPFTLSAVLTGSASIGDSDCSKNGRCKTEIVLHGPGDCRECCVSPSWNFLGFVASEFNALAQICPGGYDVNGQCCADINRNSNNTCAVVGVVTSLIERCTVIFPPGFEIGDHIPYTCSPL